MMKYFYTILFLVASSLNIMGQSTEKIWKLINENKRAEAFKISKKIKPEKANMEQLILQQIVRYENGKYKKDPNFLPAFVKKPDFERYLYGLWNENYVFGIYHQEGFYDDILDNIDFFRKIKLLDPTVKSSIDYVIAIADRYRNRWEQYYQEQSKLLGVTDWQVCGVFENLNGSGIDIPYPPEKLAYSKEDFNANSNGMINWFVPKLEKKEPYTVINYPEYGSGINYAQTFFKNAQPREVIFKLGSSGKFKMWLDDALLLEQHEDQTTELDAYAVKVNLPAGNHRILIKLENYNNPDFILRVFDKENHLLNPEKLHFTTQVLNYKKLDKNALKTEVLDNPFEQYFKNLNNKKFTPFFKDFMLASTYMRNERTDEAKKIVLKNLKKYPKSTLLRKMLVDIYYSEGDEVSAKEVTENIKRDDKESPYVYLLMIRDTDKLMKMPLEEMNEKLDKIVKAIDFDMVTILADFMKAARSGNMDRLKKVMEEGYKRSEQIQNTDLMVTFASVYGQAFNQKEKTLDWLSKAENELFDENIYNVQGNIYNELNEKDKVIALDKKLIKYVPDLLSYKEKIIGDLFDQQKYPEALPYINEGLELFPYSYNFMKYKGDVYLQKDDKKEALKWYEKSFSYDSGNYDLRKTIDDLKKQPDPIKDLKLQKPYEYIAQKRGKKRKEKKDFNILLSSKNIQLFNEGGNRIQRTFIYEVTSQKGVERLKEINLGLDYNYVINKSEIVKPDGKIVPAEKSGSSFVFNNLSIGDVIYIDYEKVTNKTGRFYKDFYDKINFESFYPLDNVVYRIITTPKRKISYQFDNGKLPVKTKRNGAYKIYEWSKQDVEALPNSENYRPNLYEFAPTLYVSTIKNWKEISNWYADLVKPQIKYTHVVNELFNKLFPNGTANLSDEQKARKIYNYITDSLTYSYVSFKQSGFVPQRPAKTIKTKLGDCKDFSTLFVALGRKAGLKTNIVLVSTSDYGRKNLVLPAIDFNHAIVRIFINGKEHYQELTNKYLPFGSTPNSLIDALALNVPFQSSEDNNNQLFLLNKDIKTDNRRYIDAKILLDDGTQALEITNRSVNNNGYYREMFEEKNPKKLKQNLEKNYEQKSDLDLNLKDYKVIKNDKNDPEFVFRLNFTADNSPQKIGKLKLYKLPRLQYIYTKDLINTEKRFYPINYRNYESNDFYETDYVLELKPGHKFIEIPENVDLKYKGHHFQMQYIPQGDSKLKIVLKAKVDFATITPEEYPAFKNFVKKALEATDALVGYK